MNKKIERSALCGSISAISSKSELIRLLLASYLSFGSTTKIENFTLSGDVKSAITALSALGCKFSDGEITSPETQKNEGKITVGESGTLYRLLLPILCAIGGKYEIETENTLKNRPMDELISTLEAHNITAKRTECGVTIDGKLTSGRFEISGSVSSQYVSGLLFALPLLKGDSEITLTSPLKSEKYVEMTVNTLKSFGISVQKTPDGYFVEGDQKYVSSGVYKACGDYSTSSYYLLGGALTGEVTVTGLSESSYQPDEAFVSVLGSAGATVSRNGDAVRVKKAERLTPFAFDVDTAPDLAPTLAVLAAFCQGESTLKNVNRLRFKESDRIKSICALLTAIGVEFSLKDNALTVFGGTPKSGVIDSFFDHRIAMAGAIALLKIGGEIKGVEAVSKSAPQFFEDLQRLGGIVK